MNKANLNFKVYFRGRHYRELRGFWVVFNGDFFFLNCSLKVKLGDLLSRYFWQIKMQSEVEKFLVNECISAVCLITFPQWSFFGVLIPSLPCSLKRLHCNEDMLGNCFCS